MSPARLVDIDPPRKPELVEDEDSVGVQGY